METVLVLFIVLIQGYVFYVAHLRIKELITVLNPISAFSIIRVSIPVADIESLPPQKIANQLQKYIAHPSEQDSGIPVATISLVVSHKYCSYALKSIIDTINGYLVRNRTAVADFNLIKDIVERTAETVEGEINNIVSVPLYLGLLGTLLGIIIGFFNMPDLHTVNADSLSSSIQHLLGGVRIAMFASLIGLALTVANNAWFYRQAKTEIEKRKNDFYSFIQAELLPVLNNSVNSSLASLQMNLHKFNEDFTRNLNSLAMLLGNNHNAIIAQEKILTKLEHIDIAAFVKGNVKVLQELNKSTEAFSMFNQYVATINEALNGTSAIVGRMDDFLLRTDHLGKVAENVVATFESNRVLMEFVQSHYKSLEQSKQMFSDSVVGVGHVLDKALDEMQRFSQEKIKAMQERVLKEIDALERDYPEKWKKLDNLEDMTALLRQIKENTQSKEKNALDTKEMQKALKSIDGTLQKIYERKPWYYVIFFRRL